MYYTQFTQFYQASPVMGVLLSNEESLFGFFKTLGLEPNMVKGAVRETVWTTQQQSTTNQDKFTALIAWWKNKISNYDYGRVK